MIPALREREVVRCAVARLREAMERCNQVTGTDYPAEFALALRAEDYVREVWGEYRRAMAVLTDLEVRERVTRRVA